MSISKITATLIQCCMTNNTAPVKSMLEKGQVKIEGTDYDRFLQNLTKTLRQAHKRTKGDWNLEMALADWIKNKTATVYDFYNGHGNQPCMSLVVEETADGVWIEVLK